jgi:hypothetical protein
MGKCAKYQGLVTAVMADSLCCILLSRNLHLYHFHPSPCGLGIMLARKTIRPSTMPNKHPAPAAEKRHRVSNVSGCVAGKTFPALLY